MFKRLSFTLSFSLLLWGGVMRAQTPTITAVNGAGTGLLCPGGRAFIQGTNLGGSGAAVTVGGKPAYVLNDSGPANLDVEIPVDAPLGATTLKVGGSAPFNISLVQYAPGMLSDGQADNLAAAYHVAFQAPVTAAFPASPNEQLMVMVNGLGPTNPSVPTGSTTGDNSAVTKTLPTIAVGGQAATVAAAYLDPNSPGIYDVVFTVPAGVAAGTQKITVAIGGSTSPAANLPVATGPVIGIVTNDASYISPALPNGGIAQGSIFILKGNNLGPASLAIAPSAFQTTTVSGTSVSVTVNGTTVAAPMYYTSTGQVAALLPSSTPTGTGTITATYNNQPGPAHPVTVVASALGLYSVTSDGQGVAVVSNPADYSLVTPAKAANCGGLYTSCGAANPGDNLILWGTGMGPVSGNETAGAGVGQNLIPNAPVTVWLGGVKAPVAYAGRAGIGYDQINITIPSNAPTGCAVPLAVQVGSTVSNGLVIPVAVGSRNCTPASAAFATAAIQQEVSAGPVNIGYIDMEKGYSGNSLQDTVSFQFGKITALAAGTQPFFLSIVDDQPAGTCQVYNNLSPGNSNPITGFQSLDAGASFALKGPNSSVTLAAQGGTLSSNGTFLAPGAVTVTGGGGKDIGAFSGTVNIPGFPSLTSPVSANGLTVTAANGMQVSWTGGGGNVIVAISSASDSTFTTGATVACVAPASAGGLTIPAWALSVLPTGSNTNFQTVYGKTSAAFTASGLDFGFISTASQGTSFQGLKIK